MPVLPSSPALRARILSGLDLVAITAGLCAFALTAWTCFCIFPIHAWNDVRLRASYLIADGIPLYPGLDQGLITTWMYGPAHPLMFLPVTFFRDLQPAYMAAGALNILQYVLVLAFVCFFWPGKTERRAPARSALALTLCLLVVPHIFLTILQADNVSLLCGLLSITCLAMNLTKPTAATLWGAAFFGVSAAFAKLHGTAVIAGEALWLFLLYGPKKLPPFLLRSAICTAVWCLFTFSISSSPTAGWDHIIRLPSQLPWVENFIERLHALRAELLLMVVLPGVVIAILHRLKAITRLGALPIFVWVASLPIGIMGALKTGGSSNSLHGVYYLLPLFFIELGADPAHPLRRSIMRAVLVTTLLGLCAFHFSGAAKWLPSAPMMLHADQAAHMARTHPNSIWLPWRPLANFMATGNHYHDEDGLYVRQVTGLYPSQRHALAELPPHWSLTAIEVPGMIWSIALVMQPTPGERSQWGGWHLFSFQPQPPP